MAVMRLLAAAKPAAASAGLDLLLAQRREQGIRFPEEPLSQQQVSCGTWGGVCQHLGDPLQCTWCISMRKGDNV